MLTLKKNQIPLSKWLIDNKSLKEPNLLIPGKKPVGLTKPVPLVENWIRFPEAINLVTKDNLNGSIHGTQVYFEKDKLNIESGSYNWTQTTYSHSTEQTWVLITQRTNTADGDCDIIIPADQNVSPSFSNLVAASMSIGHRGYSAVITFERSVLQDEPIVIVFSLPGPTGTGFWAWVYTTAGEYLGDNGRTGTSSTPCSGTYTLGIGHASGFIRRAAVYDYFSLAKSTTKEEARLIALNPYQFLEPV